MIRHLASPGRPGGLAAELGRQVRREFGLLAEPFVLHAPVPELMAAAWVVLRESVIARGRLPRPVKEAIALAVSRGNRCPYCVDAHGMMLHALGAGRAEAALAAGRPPAGQELGPDAAARIAWSVAAGRAEAAAAQPCPFTTDELPEAIATVLCFQYVNRMATVFLGESPLPLTGPRTRPWLVRWAGRWLRRTARTERAAGGGLALLSGGEPAAPPPWAADHPTIGAAFAHFEAAVERAARPVLDEMTRRRLSAHLVEWRGEEPPLGRDWLGSEDAAGRLALLTARAPHRVTDEDVAALRRRHAADAALVAVAAWGSFHAARRISQWLTEPAS